MTGIVTRAGMRTRVRSLANMETAAASAFITDTEINQWLDDAIRELYDKLVWARGDDYYATVSSQTMTAGTATYYVTAPSGSPLLPTPEYYKLLEVVASDGSRATRVPRFAASGEYAQQYNRSLQGNASCIDDLRYRHTSTLGQIELMPAPGGAWTLKCVYIPAYTTMTADSSTGGTFDGINGWEEWAVVTAAIKCLEKEESDPAALMSERARIEARIERMAASRDAEPMRVVDTRRDRTGRYTLGGLSDSWDW